MKIKTIIIIFVITLLNLAPINAVRAAEPGILEQISKYTGSSLGVLILSTIGAIYSVVLYNAAEEQEKEANANIQKLDALIKVYQDSFANLCPNGRDRLEEPKCFCYLESGAKNTTRNNSQTCQALWAKNDYKVLASAGDYKGKPIDPVGCVNLNGQFDEKCTCKKFVNAKGDNSCMKTTGLTIPTELGSGFATGSGLNQVAAFSNNAANGNHHLNNLRTGAFNKNAIDAKKFQQAMLNKLAPHLPPNAANILKANEKNVNRLAASVIGEKGMREAFNGTPSAVSIASGRNVDNATSTLLDQAATKAGLTELTGGKGINSKKANGKDNLKFNFMNDADGTNTSQVQNFPEKKYDFKENDINKNPDTSIFEIISNRYINSGLRRLFDN